MTHSEELLADIRLMYSDGHPLVLELAAEYEIAIAQALRLEDIIHEMTK